MAGNELPATVEPRNSPGERPPSIAPPSISPPGPHHQLAHSEPSEGAPNMPEVKKEVESDEESPFVWREDYLAEGETPEQDNVGSDRRKPAKKSQRLLPVHLLIYDAILRRGGTAALSDLVRDLSPLYAGLRSKQGAQYNRDVRRTMLCVLKRSGLFLELANQSWSISEDVADFYYKQLSVEAIAVVRAKVIQRVNEESKTVTQDPDDDELFSLIAYSISMHGGSASVTDIHKDVEPILMDTSSYTGRKRLPSLLASIEAMLETPRFRHRSGMWSLSPSALSSVEPDPKRRAADGPGAASMKRAKSVDMPGWTNGDESSEHCTQTAPIKRDTTTALLAPRIDTVVQQRQRVATEAERALHVSTAQQAVKLLISDEAEILSSQRLKHFDMVNLSELTTEALFRAIAAKKRIQASDIGSVCLVKESLHALVAIDEDWQVQTLKDYDQLAYTTK